MADTTPDLILTDDWRDDDGALRSEIVEAVTSAIAGGDAARLKDLVGEAH